eukprot:7131159-Pyramimonas_sp.AAC.1
MHAGPIVAQGQLGQVSAGARVTPSCPHGWRCKDSLVRRRRPAHGRTEVNDRGRLGEGPPVFF